MAATTRSSRRARAGPWRRPCAPGGADVYVVGNLGHVDIGPGGIADTLLLWQASYRLLAQRDGLSVPDPARCALATTSAPG